MSCRGENVLACHAVATLSPIESDDQLLSVLCVSRQAQRSQAAHVFDNSPMASRLLPECIIDLGFASLIALEYALCCDTGFCITHNTPLFYKYGNEQQHYQVLSCRAPLCTVRYRRTGAPFVLCLAFRSNGSALGRCRILTMAARPSSSNLLVSFFHDGSERRPPAFNPRTELKLPFWM
jgi:hypothetical protein